MQGTNMVFLNPWNVLKKGKAAYIQHCEYMLAKDKFYTTSTEWCCIV